MIDMDLEGDVGHTIESLLEAVSAWEKGPDWWTAPEKIKSRTDKLLNGAFERQARADLEPELQHDRRNVQSLNTFLPGKYVKVKVTQYSVKMRGRLGQPPVFRGP